MKRYGIERRLAVEFGRSLLCTIPTAIWAECVRAAGAHILSEIAHGTTRAFLLSESTLIVGPRELVLMTCGGMSQDAFLRHLGAVVHAPVTHVTYALAAHPSMQSEGERLRQADLTTLSRALPKVSIEEGRADARHLLVADAANPQDAAGWVQSLQVRMRELLAGAAECVVDDHVFSPPGYSLNALTATGYVTVHASTEHHQSLLSIEHRGAWPSRVLTSLHALVDSPPPSSSHTDALQG